MAQSPEPLSDLFRSEGADAVELEAEDDAVFFSQADIKGVVLHGDGAAVPTVTNRDRRTDQRSIALARTRLEIEEE